MTSRAFSAAAVAALLSAVQVPGLAQGDDAAALLAKHQAFVGWHAGDGVIKTLRSRGEITHNGKTVETLTMLRYGIAHRETGVTRSSGLQGDSGFTGRVYWTSNENGFTVRPVGEIGRYLYDDDSIFGELTGAGDFTPRVLRHESVDGADTVVLRLTSQIGFPLDAYVDPASGAYKRVTIDPGGKYEETLNGIGYTVAGGKRFISTWRYGDSKYVHTYTEIEPNAAIEPDQLRPPKQTATWTFADGTSPVELTKDSFPRLLIDVVLNGVKGRFILDTGADSTVLVDSFARKVGAKRMGHTSLSGIGPDSVAANIYHVDTLAVGPSLLHDLIITSGIDEQWFKEEGAVGLIGFDLLAAAIVDLNLDTGTLRIQDPAKVQPDEQAGLVVRVDLSDRHIRVPMKLNDKHDVIATLDSGNPLNVLFSRDLVFRDHLVFFTDPTQLGSERLGGGIGGTEIEHCGHLQSLTLGPVVYRPVPACDSPSYARNEVLVGLDFMKAFNYVFDYPDGIIVMTPRKNP